MPAKRYRVSLSVEEQQELKGLVSRGRTAAYKQTHARIMLLSDENQERGAMKDEEIARVLRVGDATVGRVRRRCVEEGVEAALGRREQVNRWTTSFRQEQIQAKNSLRERSRSLYGTSPIRPGNPDLRQYWQALPLAMCRH